MMDARLKATAIAVVIALTVPVLLVLLLAPHSDKTARILFVSDQSGDHEIWVMNEDGSNPRQLTHMPPDNGSPSWSPDGRKIVFVSATGDEGKMATFVMDADGDNVQQIIEPALTWYGSPRFMPTGSTIHFNRGELVMQMGQDGRERQVGIVGSYPHVSPDGSLWAYARSTFGRRDGVQYEARLSQPNSDEWVVLSRGWDYGVIADWSPDGERILMSCARNYPAWPPTFLVTYKPPPRDPIGVCIVNRDGTGIRQIIPEGSDPTWSPDGQWIAYVNGEIYVARADGSNAHPITSCGCRVSQIDWGP